MSEADVREEHRVVVGEDRAGLRLDRFLAEALVTSRHRVTEAIAAGEVRVDGRRAPKGQPVAAGQTITARLLPVAGPPVPQPELPLHVVYEDDAVVVLDKPAGWATHPLEPGEKGTLANALVARHPDCATAGRDVREAGFAHRLDAPTSGLVLAARTRDAWENLRAQFSARSVRKEYLALAAGAVFGPIEVKVPIGHDPGTPERRRAVGNERLLEKTEARDADTLIEVEQRLTGWTLVRCTIRTGVTHQIRVHLAHLGNPVAGDDRYGGARPEGLHRLFLHAAVLGFSHPTSGASCSFTSPLPDELTKILAALR